MRIGLLKRLVGELTNLEAELSAERGDLSLFALIEEEDWPEDGELGYCWCLYVAAPWIWDDRSFALQHIRERVRPYQKDWNPFERHLRVEVVRPTSPHLEEVWEYCNTEKGMVEIYDVDILDITARRGYIFAAQRPGNFDEILRDAQLELERQRQRQHELAREREAWLKDRAGA